jgi:hypothetical protein
MEQEKIDAYRQEVVAALVQKTADNPKLVLTQEDAQALAAYLSDEELVDGMEWNTPEDVADVLLETNPDK